MTARPVRPELGFLPTLTSARPMRAADIMRSQVSCSSLMISGPSGHCGAALFSSVWHFRTWRIVLCNAHQKFTCRPEPKTQRRSLYEGWFFASSNKRETVNISEVFSKHTLEYFRITGLLTAPDCTNREKYNTETILLKKKSILLKKKSILLKKPDLTWKTSGVRCSRRIWSGLDSIWYKVEPFSAGRFVISKPTTRSRTSMHQGSNVWNGAKITLNLQRSWETNKSQIPTQPKPPCC